MDPRRFFGATELAAVQAATAEAEGGTSGEIVTYVVGRCDDYPELGWMGAALGGVLGASLASLGHLALGAWGAGGAWLALPTVAGAGAGLALAARVPGLGRRLIPSATLDRRARLRAEAAFLDEEVFATRERTGILIFLTLYEHRAIVLGDAGINALVRPEEWQGIVDDLVAGIRRGRPADALTEAVRACGALLEARRVRRRPDDADELPDAPRLRDR